MSIPTKTLTNPLNKAMYNNLNNSTDPTAQSITTNFTTIYNNIANIASLPDNTTDVNTLDTISINIENAFKNIITVMTPCASSPDTNKCTTLASCMLIPQIEGLIIDFIILLASVIPISGIKNNYEFIGFFMQKNVTDLITNNKSNYDPTNKIYILCQKSTINPIIYSPVSDNPKLMAAYSAVNNRMTNQLSTRDERVQTNSLLQVLLYIILPAVVIILAYLAYVAYMRTYTTASPVGSPVGSPVTSPVGSEAVPLVPIITSEIPATGTSNEIPATETSNEIPATGISNETPIESNTGGNGYDFLNI